jgi:hypothetical protein
MANVTRAVGATLYDKRDPLYDKTDLLYDISATCRGKVYSPPENPSKYREVPNDWPIMIQGKERQVTPQQNGNKALLLG